MSVNDTIPLPSVRRVRIRERAQWRALQLRQEAEGEAVMVTEYTQRHLPDLADHPGLPHYIRCKVSRLALDLPGDWPGWILEQTANFFESSGWQESHGDEAIPRGQLSLSRCRQLLGSDSSEICDSELLFLRDQLQRLASISVDRILPGGSE